MITENVQRNSYRVKQFLLHVIPNGEIAIQHDRGILRVNESTMTSFVSSLDQRSGQYVYDNELRITFGDQFEQAKEFLIGNGVLEYAVPVNFQVESVNFISNCDSVESLVSQSFEGEVEEWTNYGDDFDGFEKKIKCNARDFFVSFLNPYDKAIARRLRDLYVSNTSTYSMMSYMYNNHLYIESIYAGKWKTPCHNCQIGHIESELRVGATRNITYQQVIDTLYLDSPKFMVETPLNSRLILNVAVQLSNRIDSLITMRDGVAVELEEFTKGVVMDLATRRAFTDTTHHWEMCDCYE